MRAGIRLNLLSRQNGNLVGTTLQHGPALCTTHPATPPLHPYRRIQDPPHNPSHRRQVRIRCHRLQLYPSEHQRYQPRIDSRHKCSSYIMMVGEHQSQYILLTVPKSWSCRRSTMPAPHRQAPQLEATLLIPYRKGDNQVLYLKNRLGELPTSPARSMTSLCTISHTCVSCCSTLLRLDLSFFIL